MYDGASRISPADGWDESAVVSDDAGHSVSVLERTLAGSARPVGDWAFEESCHQY